MVEVGVNAACLQIFDVKVTQIVMRHFAGVKSLATQLGQGNHRIARGAAAGLAGCDVLNV